MPLKRKSKKPRTNWKAIGKAFEKKCRDALDEYGLMVHKAGASIGYRPGPRGLVPRSVQEDIFGAFDLIGANVRITPHTTWIQCTVGGRQAIAERKEKVAAACGFLNDATNRMHVWARDQEKKYLIHAHVVTAVGRLPNKVNTLWAVYTIDTRYFQAELKVMQHRGLL